MTNCAPLTITTPHIEERLVRDEKTSEFYLPLSSTVVLNYKNDMMYVPIDFGNDLTINALVDSAAYTSAISQNELGRSKQQAPCKISWKSRILLNFKRN